MYVNIPRGVSGMHNHQSKQSYKIPTCRKQARTFIAKGLYRFPRYSPTFSLARPELLSWRNLATAGGDSSRKSFCITRSGLVNNSILCYASSCFAIKDQCKEVCFQKFLIKVFVSVVSKRGPGAMATNKTVSLCL